MTCRHPACECLIISPLASLPLHPSTPPHFVAARPRQLQYRANALKYTVIANADATCNGYSVAPRFAFYFILCNSTSLCSDELLECPAPGGADLSTSWWAGVGGISVHESTIQSELTYTVDRPRLIALFQLYPSQGSRVIPYWIQHMDVTTSHCSHPPPPISSRRYHYRKSLSRVVRCTSSYMYTSRTAAHSSSPLRGRGTKGREGGGVGEWCVFATDSGGSSVHAYPRAVLPSSPPCYCTPPPIISLPAPPQLT